MLLEIVPEIRKVHPAILFLHLISKDNIRILRTSQYAKYCCCRCVVLSRVMAKDHTRSAITSRVQAGRADGARDHALANRSIQAVG